MREEIDTAALRADYEEQRRQNVVLREDASNVKFLRRERDQLRDKNERLGKKVEWLLSRIKAKQEYIGLLEGEVGETVPIAVNHGWRSHRAEALVIARFKVKQARGEG